MVEPGLVVAVKSRYHHKLRSTAKALDMTEAQAFGHLLFLWLGAREYAEDGDLWRGDENASLRFLYFLAGEPPDIGEFISVLRSDRWLDGWLLHDWLDHAGTFLIDKYKSRHRKRLVEIWEKHGRVYGRDSPPDGDGNNDRKQTESNREESGKKAGSDREESGKEAGNDREAQGNGFTPHPSQLLTVKDVTLNPPTLKYKKRIKNPYNPINNPININNLMGGVGGKNRNALNVVSASMGRERPKSPDPPGTGYVFSSGTLGLRAQGLTAPEEDKQPGDGFSAKAVFDTFLPILVFHGITSMSQFTARVRHCRVKPAEWMMLYLDKIHAVYRDRDGSTWYENGEADPVAMTVAALLEKEKAKRHQPSDAARGLFIEMMTARVLDPARFDTHWRGRTSGPALAIELSRRKGARGKLKTTGKTDGRTGNDQERRSSRQAFGGGGEAQEESGQGERGRNTGTG